ncbi:MAG: ABC transporter ATP-binding protein [Butyrivibrio sp.]|jgi:ABC-2 type transport system ATP-binding protein|uniref:ABC transporter ATP-binding protein n=1 Tax=Butyrivibrio sp. TaxID=28121 RepID=UPI001ED0D00D|nr:ABC transporter ATP-binding protein [Butyrivibrio sp.]MBE5841265.1 ABC transporter ATP-binding protein [Butyrivibrio sp.]
MSLLEIRNLKKDYNGFKALKGVNFQVNAGEIVALLGKNGAGKTTLLNSIAGNIFPTGGDIIYKGDTLLKENSRLNEFGILIEPTFIPYMNAHDNLDILVKTTGVKIADKKIDELLKAVGLESKTNEKTKAFSFGMKQRLGLAQALLNDPEFLILDEPFVGLDPIGKNIFKHILLEKAHKEKVGILFSSHDLEDVEEICDRVVLIDNGEKKFDGVMEYSKKYVVKCDGFLNKEEFKGSGIKVDDNNVWIDHIEDLKSTFDKLENLNINVLDLEIERKSLYDLFEDG